MNLTRVPKDGADLLAQLMDVSRTTAKGYLDGYAAAERADWEEWAAKIRAEFEVAKTEAAGALEEIDFALAALADDSMAELRSMVEEYAHQVFNTRSRVAQIGAHTSWANTADRTARTANARKASMDRFERQVDPNGSLAPAERAKRAEHARKAYFLGLSLKSAKARREKAAQRTARPTPPGDSTA